MQRIFVAGHNGMVGSSICRVLRKSKDCDVEIITRDRGQLDLTNQLAVRNFFELEKPDVVYMAAAKVGGIHANNSLPADFIYQNLMIEINVINEAFRSGVRRLLFLGSSCIYPKLASQPMLEEMLLSSPLELTNEPYAIAKIAGIKLCESYNRQYGKSHGIDYRSIMPTNLYGPGDSYHPDNSHVIPGLIRKFHDAKNSGADAVTIWGSGNPRREFLYVDDLADMCVYIMGLDKQIFYTNISERCSHVNAGYGSDVTIAELAEMISKVVGFSGVMHFDRSMPDGPPRKLMDSSRLMRLGYNKQLKKLEDGLLSAYSDYISRMDKNL